MRFPGKNQPEGTQNPSILLREESPLCPISAIVEQDDRVAYFYLEGEEESNFESKFCWIRNLQKAPVQLEEKLMQQGIAPMLPRASCKFKEGQEKLDANDLQIVWTEEGDAAALLLKEEVLAIIPSWSGQQGLSRGYARDCLGQTYLAWELSASNAFLERIAAAKAYWELWERELNPFKIQQPAILDTYQEILGNCDTYYAIDGGEWPPKGLYLREGEWKTIFATVGLSLLSMPAVEWYEKDRFKANRIEIGMMLNSGLSEEEVGEIVGWISRVSTVPWEDVTFLGEGHTIDFTGLESTALNAVVFTNRLSILPSVQLDDYRGSKVNFLWMVPISEKERKEIIDDGIDEIIQKLNAIGSEIFSLQRDELV